MWAHHRFYLWLIAYDFLSWSFFFFNGPHVSVVAFVLLVEQIWHEQRSILLFPSHSVMASCMMDIEFVSELLPKGLTGKCVPTALEL